MKVIAYSAWEKPEIFTASNKKSVNRIKKSLKENQRSSEILTEREFRKRFRNT